jgi:hypothetical protein
MSINGPLGRNDPRGAYAMRCICHAVHTPSDAYDCLAARASVYWQGTKITAGVLGETWWRGNDRALHATA